MEMTIQYELVMLHTQMQQLIKQYRNSRAGGKQLSHIHQYTMQGVEDVARKLSHIYRQFLIDVYAEQNVERRQRLTQENHMQKLISLLLRLKQYAINLHNLGELRDDDYTQITECVSHGLEYCSLTSQNVQRKIQTQQYCCDMAMQQTEPNVFRCAECGQSTKKQLRSKRGGWSDSKSKPGAKNVTYAAMKHFDDCFKNIFIGQ